MNVAVIDILEEIQALLTLLNSVRMDELDDHGFRGVHATLGSAINKVDRLIDEVRTLS